MSDIMERLADLGREVDALDEAINGQTAALESPPTDTKRFPMFESVAFVVALNSGGTPTAQTFAPREQFWNNASWDAYITEVTYSVYGWQATSFGAANVEYQTLVDSEAGMLWGTTMPVGGNWMQSGVIFDFEWNYRMPSSGRTYANGNARYLSRKSLGNKYRDQMLRFTDPLFVKAGDYLVWMMRPTVFNPGAVSLAPAAGLSPFSTIVVNFHVNGYRDGTMAEAAYEQP